MIEKVEDLYSVSNYKTYILTDTLGLDEATALSLGMNPDVATWDIIEKLRKRGAEGSRIYEVFSGRYKKIKDAYLEGTFCDVRVYRSAAGGGIDMPYGPIRIPLLNFFKWGKEKQYEFDKAFVTHIESKISKPNWEKLYKEKCMECDSYQRELAEKKKGNTSASSNQSKYTTPYLQIMHGAIEELEISQENQPKVDGELIPYFTKKLEAIGEKSPQNKAKLMSTFVRLPESATGGNSKTKKIKNPPN